MISIPKEFRRCTSLGLLLAIAGCSQEQVQQLKNQVSQQAETVAQKATDAANRIAPSVKEQVAPDGGASIQVEALTEFPASFAQLLTISGRGSVLQLRSYADPSEEKFPSYFFQANTTAQRLDVLVGQEFSGDLFVRSSDDSATWFSKPNVPVTLKVDQRTETQLEGTILRGELTNALGKSCSVSGSFQAIVIGHDDNEVGER